jgi:hypothetical protein
MKMPGRRGIALIVVLGVLVLLSLLAAAFATLSGTEARTARNYLDTVRARLVAQSGVEAAVARLDELLERGTLLTETDWVPLERPIRVNGVDLRPAGILESTSYARRGDFYTLRITDANARINVNDGVAWGPDHPVSRNLRRLLNVLGAQPGVDLADLGDRVLSARPPSGYADMADVVRAVGEDRVREFLTVRSWSDPNVCQPTPLSPEAARSPAYPPGCGRLPGGAADRFRYGHQKNSRGEPIDAPLLFFDPDQGDPAHNAVWGRDSLVPRWIEIVTRSPVNVNTARREVLVALLVDLEGFFLVERRRGVSETPDGVASPCQSPGGAYGWTALRYGYDGRLSAGDECGFLYRTLPFVGPGGRSSNGIPAAAIVDEILACRSRLPSPRIPALDYAAAPFGGPFRTWAQFGRFVDRLVEEGLIAETRTDWFWDVDASGSRLPAPLQLRAASQAIGDVLKANFNPNLHLNELNPDRALFTHVDKTDLLVHSTEFSFTPMGAFEIESVGRIVRPIDGGDDAAAASDNEVVATRTIVAQVRLFDAVRETSQAQFAGGTFGPKKGPLETNNNGGVESGPEPDNGPAPAENRAEGYLQLPTIGSNFPKGERKPPGELWTTLSDPSWYPGAKATPPGGIHLGSSVHAHFQLDHVAHHHASRNFLTSPPTWDGFRLPQGAWQTVFGRRCCLNRNWEDRTESIPGPYGPVDAGRAGASRRYGLARSEPDDGAPGDLRLDGAYVERGSAFGYWIDENWSFNVNEGTAAFWLKPAFFPEQTGKRRTLLSMGRIHSAARDRMNPSPFALYFVPPNGDGEGRGPNYFGGPGLFRPASLAFGYGFSTKSGYNWEVGGSGGPDDHATSHGAVFSPTLNHEGHGPDNHDRFVGDDGRFNSLRAHEWTHVAVAWNIPRNRLPTADSLRIYVNGRILPGSLGEPHLLPEQGQPFAQTPRWATHAQQVLIPGVPGARWCKNSIRLGGEPSMLIDALGPDGLYPGNYTADATFDEFYLWLDRSPGWNGGVWGAQTLWNRGRYYRPDDHDPEDARFVSRPIDLSPPRARTLPPPGPPAASVTGVRVLGLAWTEWAEAYDRDGAKMLDHSAAPPRDLRPEGGTFAHLYLELDGAWHGPFRKDGWSPLRGASGPTPVLADPAHVRYAVKLTLGGPSTPGTILLASPVVDDVTLYFRRGRQEILSWVSP